MSSQTFSNTYCLWSTAVPVYTWKSATQGIRKEHIRWNRDRIPLPKETFTCQSPTAIFFHSPATISKRTIRWKQVPQRCYLCNTIMPGIKPGEKKCWQRDCKILNHKPKRVSFKLIVHKQTGPSQLLNAWSCKFSVYVRMHVDTNMYALSTYLYQTCTTIKASQTLKYRPKGFNIITIFFYWYKHLLNSLR